MPEDLTDVKTEGSSTSEQVVEQADTTAAETVDQSQTQESSTQEVKPEVETKPDRPEINYAMEAARKASEALEAVRQLQQQQQQQQVPQQPQYSKAQLRAFAEQTTDAQQKIWALEEIDKLEKNERQSEMKQLFEGYTKKTQEDMQKQESFRFVVQNFPEVAHKDEAGNFIGFNQASPLYQKINEYMSNPKLREDPQGLVVAAKMAAFDLGVSMNQKLTNKINQTTAQLRKEQKRQLISGGGTPAQTEGSTSKRAKLAEEYRKTGSKEAFKQLAKLQGLIPEM